MKVLQINLTDYYLNGGSAITMHRLHLALRKAGGDSKILCKLKTLESADHTAEISRPLPIKIAEALLKQATSRLGFNEFHAVSTFGIKKNQFYLEADVLNFHSIEGGFFNYLALPTLTKSKPAVFTLHDVWGYTGHCSYSYDCDRWRIGCGKCPYPEVFPAIKRDSTRLEWKIKDWVYSHSHLAIVTPSRWITEQARQSMLKRFSIHHIPHGIDTDVYQPLDPEHCRAALRIPTG
ncbi:MAG TPA: glycosyltransferase, partial [Candidatus Caenarcaniphilales bacterium]